MPGWLAAIVVNVFLIVLLGVGLYHSRHIDLVGFITERDKVSAPYLIGTFVATSVGGGVIVGMVSMGYDGGAVGFVVGGSYMLGFFVLA